MFPQPHAFYPPFGGVETLLPICGMLGQSPRVPSVSGPASSSRDPYFYSSMMNASLPLSRGATSNALPASSQPAPVMWPSAPFSPQYSYAGEDTFASRSHSTASVPPPASAGTAQFLPGLSRNQLPFPPSFESMQSFRATSSFVPPVEVPASHFPREPLLPIATSAVTPNLPPYPKVGAAASIVSSPNPSRVQAKPSKLPCSMCNRTFRTKALLLKHDAIHRGDGLYKCPEPDCNKSFNQKIHLTNHLRVHSGSRPFVCKICNHAFKQDTNLVCHIRTHTGEKPFQCHLCDQAFKQKGHLSSHLERIHHTIAPTKSLKRRAPSSPFSSSSSTLSLTE